MPIRRGMGGLSSGAGGNLFDRPGFFDNSEIDNLTVQTQLLIKAASETYGIIISKGDQSGASQTYTASLPVMSADGEILISNATQTSEPEENIKISGSSTSFITYAPL